jgi:hypothetical protein
MKVKLKNLILKRFALGSLILGISPVALFAGPQAFELVKLGDQYVGIQSKDRVVQIRSDKSIASLTPDIWYVVYYDPDATFNAVEVKFGAGQKMDVSHPGRVLELFSDDKRPLDPAKLVVDSDEALKIASTQPILKNLTLRASQLWLEHGDLGPQWRVKLWAAKLSDPSDSVDIGTVILSADDGSLIKVDIHPGSVD